MIEEFGGENNGEKKKKKKAFEAFDAWLCQRLMKLKLQNNV